MRDGLVRCAIVWKGTVVVERTDCEPSVLIAVDASSSIVHGVLVLQGYRISLWGGHASSICGGSEMATAHSPRPSLFLPFGILLQFLLHVFIVGFHGAAFSLDCLE